MVAADDSPAEGQEEPNGSNNGDQSEVKVVNESAAASSSSSTPNNASPQQSSKKRRSDIQLNKDDHPEGHTCDDNDDDELNDEGTKRTDPFKRAPDEVLKKRKIVKASSKWSSGGDGTNTSGGMFASVNLAPTTTTTTTTTNNSEKDATDNTPIFGSSSKVPTFGSTTGSTSSSSGFGSAATKTSGGFGSGFGSVSNGFGALKPSMTEKKADDKNNDGGDSETKTTTGFGSGFGAVSSGFGALKSSTSTSFGFGSNNTTPKSSSPDEVITTDTNNGSGLAGTFANGSPTKKTTASPSKFPISSVVDTDNGEKDEECLCQVRAKLFKMVPEDETNTEQDGSALKGDVPSVPSTTGRMELVKKATKGDGSPEKGDKSPEKGKGSTTNVGPKLVQKEAGIGPVRVLKRKPGKGENEGDDEKQATSARVVQRQETCGGGQAFRVILNIRLIPKTCTVIRRGDKFVQLNAPNSQGELESSLFKVKTTVEGDLLEKNLKAVLG